MNRHAFDGLSTSSLRAMYAALAAWPWRRLFARFRIALAEELDARELASFADDTGAHPCRRVGGLQ